MENTETITLCEVSNTATILDAIIVEFPVNLNLFEGSVAKHAETFKNEKFTFNNDLGKFVTVPSREMVIRAIRSQFNANMMTSKRSDNYEMIYRYCLHFGLEEKMLIYEALKNVETEKVKHFHQNYRSWKTTNITHKDDKEQKKTEKKAAQQKKNLEDAIIYVRDNFADFVNNPAITDDHAISFGRVLGPRIDAIRTRRASEQGEKF